MNSANGCIICNMKAILVTLTIIVVCGVGFGSYEYGHIQGTKTGKNLGWQSGYDKGHQAGLAEVGPRISDDESKLSTMADQYNQLSDNYNNLRNAIIQYAGTAGSYKVSTRISCTSNSLGGYTYTNCY